ncbi:MAG: hypothetical protein MI757_22670 [Pirellulales bacterium]|nr:hypothetical protein [Pirellulales bacterium]
MTTNRVVLAIAVVLLHAIQPNRNEAADLEVPRSRGFGRAAVIDDHIYYFGGGSDEVDVLDPLRRAWSRQSLGVSSPQILGDQIDGELYVMDPFSRKFRRIDPKTERVTDLAKVPTRRVNGTLIACGGKIYVIGGYSMDIAEENCIEIYDPKTNRWSRGPRLPGYRPLDHFHAATVVDGKLHVVGGLLKGNKGQPHWRLDGDRWTARAAAPLHAMWKHNVLAAAADKIYLIAPHPASAKNQRTKTKSNIYAYHPSTDRWKAVGKTPKGMSHGLFAQAVVGKKIYILGGVGTKAVHVFNAAIEKWE